MNKVHVFIANLLKLETTCKVLLKTAIFKVRRSECLLFKKCLASITPINAMGHGSGNKWVKQCSIMYKTLTYSNFEALDFKFDIVLYYIYFYVPWFINISNQYTM